MRWKRFCGFVWAALAVSVFGSGLVSQNANAEEVYNPYGVMAFRSYWSSASGVVNDNAWNSPINSYGKSILQNVSGQNRRLYGFTIDWNLNDLSSNATKTVTANVTLIQYATTGNSFQNGGGTIQVSTSNGLKQGNCQFINPTNNDTPHRATWTCTVSVDNFATINNGQIVIGKIRTAEINDTAIATLCGQSIAPDCNGNVDLVEFSYNINYSNDPNTSILDEQLELQKQQAEQEAQDREDLQNNQDSAADAGADAGASAEAGGQTLIAAFTSLVAALGQVHQTNCELPDFEINGLEFENLNLCAVSVPTEIAALGSLLMVFLIVPLGINVVKRIISLYNELIGGK